MRLVISVCYYPSLCAKHLASNRLSKNATLAFFRRIMQVSCRSVCVELVQCIYHNFSVRNPRYSRMVPLFRAPISAGSDRLEAHIFFMFIVFFECPHCPNLVYLAWETPYLRTSLQEWKSMPNVCFSTKYEPSGITRYCLKKMNSFQKVHCSRPYFVLFLRKHPRS